MNEEKRNYGRTPVITFIVSIYMTENLNFVSTVEDIRYVVIPVLKCPLLEFRTFKFCGVSGHHLIALSSQRKPCDVSDFPKYFNILR